MKIVEGKDGSVSLTVESAPLAPMPLQVERDELLAALKDLVDQNESAASTLAVECESALIEAKFKPSKELETARALIARIEGGKKSCNLHADCAAADEAVRE